MIRPWCSDCLLMAAAKTPAVAELEAKIAELEAKLAEKSAV